ncbi:bromodomain adjacent to zinc finger domain protein 2B-like [Panicum miliaceum]|uniref:Bromodomain adjacent to zinc finger domain protein 2B-like n=1 Tax=Panicum miliaceum TaxID=4540 RepID=A0A3L6SP62_PANMI|nr:bromodomain adjacent to zinc finger domain protein 2B-like [Panicum miliaceum]
MEGSDGGDADDEDGGDGEDEAEEEDDDEFEVRSDVNGAAWPPPYDVQAPSSASLPGTPDRGARAAAARSSSSPPWWPGPSGGKEYASETEARWPPGAGRRQRYHHRERMAREVWLERAWRARKQRQEAAAAVPVVVIGGGESPAAGRGGVAMDMEEVRACRDLGLGLPCDWTVEIPCHALSGVDTASSGGNSPASGSWRISSPGDDPRDVKARLKVWAQAVALASAASRLGS